VDVCISVSSFTAAKSKIMDTSVPVNFDDTNSTLVPYPKESRKFLVLVEPFKAEVLILATSNYVEYCFLIYHTLCNQSAYVGLALHPNNHCFASFLL